MMQAEMPVRVTPEEYILRERDALERHQYSGGEVSVIQGGSATHSATTTNVIGGLARRLKRSDRRVYEASRRVGVPITSFFTYPDLSVVCGEVEFDPQDSHQETIVNPTVIVEVFSPATEAWDRGGKFENYQKIESLREYVLVSSQAAAVETFFRQGDGTWLYTAVAAPTANVKLQSLNIELPLAEIYAGVSFPPPVIDVPQER